MRKVFGTRYEAARNRIPMNISSPIFISLLIMDPRIGKPFLPDGSAQTELPTGTKREASFDELNRTLNAQA